MTHCTECKGEVNWVKEGDRWRCYNQDGSDHWDLCSKRKWEQVKATGKRFVNEKLSPWERADGYKDSIHGTKMSRHARAAVGDVKFSGQCKACVPPWEVCATCPDLIRRKPEHVTA